MLYAVVLMCSHIVPIYPQSGLLSETFGEWIYGCRELFFYYYFRLNGRYRMVCGYIGGAGCTIINMSRLSFYTYRGMILAL